MGEDLPYYSKKIKPASLTKLEVRKRDTQSHCKHTLTYTQLSKQNKMQGLRENGI